MGNNESLNAIEVAEMLKIAKNTVYELVKRGELPSYKVGKKLRIDKADVESYIISQKNTKKNANTNMYQSSVQEDVLIGELVDGNKEISITSTNDLIIGGQDTILDILSDYIKLKIKDTRVLRNNVGSYNNLYDLYNEKISLCSVHLWDGYTEDYNLEYVKRLLPGVPCIVINLAYRFQGFYVAKDNPHKINTWTDLTKSNISIINREKGSGTRVLLDEKLRVNSIKAKDIKGYDIEKKSHISVASSIARGEGDVGLGIEKISYSTKGIDFIPLQEERYDLVIRKDKISPQVIKVLLDIIKSKEFKEEIDGLSGYDLRDIGKILLDV